MGEGQAPCGQRAEGLKGTKWSSHRKAGRASGLLQEWGVAQSREDLWGAGGATSGTIGSGAGKTRGGHEGFDGKISSLLAVSTHTADLVRAVDAKDGNRIPQA